MVIELELLGWAVVAVSIAGRHGEPVSLHPFALGVGCRHAFRRLNRPSTRRLDRRWGRRRRAPAGIHSLTVHLLLCAPHERIELHAVVALDALLELSRCRRSGSRRRRSPGPASWSNRRRRRSCSSAGSRRRRRQALPPASVPTSRASSTCWSRCCSGTPCSALSPAPPGSGSRRTRRHRCRPSPQRRRTPTAAAERRSSTRLEGRWRRWGRRRRRWRRRWWRRRPATLDCSKRVDEPVPEVVVRNRRRRRRTGRSCCSAVTFGFAVPGGRAFVPAISLAQARNGRPEKRHDADHVRACHGSTAQGTVGRIARGDRGAGGCHPGRRCPA